MPIEMRWGDALEGYWLENDRRLSRKTVTNYSWAFRRFGAFVGMEHDVFLITPDVIRRFLNSLEAEGLAGKSQANIWVALSAFFTWAEREPALRMPHPIRGVVARPRVKKPLIVPYTRTEVRALLQACERGAAWQTRNGFEVQSRRATARRDATILTVLVDTGLRASELCRARVDDYDARTGRLQVLGKGAKERAVFLSKAARKRVWAYMATRAGADGAEPLFASRNGQALTAPNLLKLLKRVAARADVAGATLHRFRHTFAINYLRNGGSVLALQRMMGHEKVDTLNIYVKLAEHDLADAQARHGPASVWGL